MAPNHFQKFDDFSSYIIHQVSEKQSQYPHANGESAFAHWAAEVALANLELDSDEIYNLMINKQGKYTVDLVYLDDKNGIHYVFVSLFDGELKTYTNSEVNKTVENLSNLIQSTDFSNNERLINASNQIKQSIKYTFEIRFVFLVYGDLSDTSIELLQDYTERLGFNASYIVFDIEKLYEDYCEIIGIRQNLGDIKMSVPLYEYKNKYIILDEISPYSIVANVDLVEYAREVSRFIPRIFDANVRNPLKNSINSKMADTIMDPYENKYFWHYNNGLTIIVEDIEIDEGVLKLTGPTIVNGCQTTDTLSKSIKKMGRSADNISLPLLIRFIKVKSDEMDDTLRLSIARYTNQQAPVIAPDFKSNEDEQEIIANNFFLLTPKVFYERKRGQWRSKTKVEQAKFDRSVTMVDVGQRWYAFKVSPSKSVVNKGELFKDDGIYKMVFTPPKSAAEYYVAYLLFEKFEIYLKEQKLKAEGKSDAQSSLFLVLARAKNLVAAHMTHLVGELITRKYGDLNSAMASAVLSKIANNKLVEMLLPHLVTVLKQYNMTLPKDQSWISTWKSEDAIYALEDLLFQHIDSYESTFDKNLLDII